MHVYIDAVVRQIFREQVRELAGAAEVAKGDRYARAFDTLMARGVRAHSLGEITTEDIDEIAPTDAH